MIGYKTIRYAQLCRQLGFTPEVQFVKLTQWMD